MTWASRCSSENFRLSTCSAPSFAVLDKTLNAIYDEAREEVIKTLNNLREEFECAGYTGGYCEPQLDLTTIVNGEFCTASASVIRVGSLQPEHISLAMRDFSGTHKEIDVKKWIKQVFDDDRWKELGKLRLDAHVMEDDYLRAQPPKPATRDGCSDEDEEDEDTDSNGDRGIGISGGTGKNKRTEGDDSEMARIGS